jgi:hypothetical protein
LKPLGGLGGVILLLFVLSRLPESSNGEQNLPENLATSGASLSEVIAQTGCKSDLSDALKNDIFLSQYANRWMKIPEK